MTTTPPEGALERLRSHPRLPLGLYPTPLEEAPRLREALEPRPPRILLKRDDYTAFGLGGNKVRKVELELAPGRAREADVVLTTGGVQSNHARVTAAAAAKLGKRCVLVLNGEPQAVPRGNALLHRLFGARIEHVATAGERASRMEELAGELRAAGEEPLVIPLGASTPLGALGYALAGVEVAEQLPGPGGPHRASGEGAAPAAAAPAESTGDGDVGRGAGTTWIFVASSSCGTLAGLALGLRLAGRDDIRLVGVSADVPATELEERTHRLATAAGELLGWSEPRGVTDGVEGTDAFVGEGYGIPTPAAEEATRLLARTEGVVLDPVYTAKAASGMIRRIRDGCFAPEDTVVFWHTGGWPGLFRS